MKSYYDHLGITIYHGDCQEVMESLLIAQNQDPVECLIADPPFNAGKDYGKVQTTVRAGLSMRLGFRSGCRLPLPY